MNMKAQIKIDRRKIAGDIVSVGVTLGVVIGIIVAVGPQVHLPASAIAALVTVSSIIATVVAEARRIRDAKVAAAKAAAAKKPVAKRAPRRSAGK